ncbi:MAG: thrombospondin type 3 repeat-containing protein [Gammaproteobacteria bacterium]|nr:thrombospondin type 3 repeat-containing protein [Gammaproteobacteria bacterium]MDH5593507.1 thrombospondin type 3 repeat-containing protein [Gammaproteobacteria bacterium]
MTQSSNYHLAGEMVSNASSGEMVSTSYQLIAGFTSPPDTDMDAVKDFMDNCIVVSNTDQRDTDSDGYGNACDPDLNQDGAVNFVDLGLLKAVFFTSNENADLNGDGAVNFLDLGLLKSMFFKPPGPSGIAP